MVEATRRAVVLGLSTALAMPAVLRRAHAAEVTLRLSHFLPPVSAGHRTMFQPWAEKVAADSDGRIEVQIFPSMQLGGRPPEMVDQVRNGIADFGWALPHYQPGRFPLMETWTLPFQITTTVETTPALYEFMSTTGADEFAEVVPLAWWLQTPGIFMTKGFGVTSAADLSGRSIRGGNEIITRTLTELGANGVFFPVPEAPQNLATGTIDGVALPYEIVPAFRFHELVDNFSEPEAGGRGFYSVPMLFLMNRRRYESLPDDLRAVIDANAGLELSNRFAAIFEENDGVGRKMAEDAGATFNTIPAAEMDRWRETAQPIFDGYVEELTGKGFDGAAVVSEVEALVASHASG
jgi:TRAP-type C4-dicarboxylate transport system substrate-binding protein